MKYISRNISPQLKKALKGFSAIVLTGPRRSGKTTVLRHILPKASYYLLEDPDILMRVKADPRGFLEEIQTPVILDEIQNAPELFRFIRTLIDSDPQKKGQWILTGSQEFTLMKGVSESMAGRAAIFQLLPFAYNEIKKWDLTMGFFPEVIQRPTQSKNWFRSYIQTYIERDVHTFFQIRDLITFRKFLFLIASRNGQLLNKSDIAAPLGISVPTVTQWVNILEATGLVFFVPPYFENFGKRLIKTAKLYWTDPGLLCFLLGIDTKQSLEKSPFVGLLFEGFIASEIIKNQVNCGKLKNIYFFRDEQGLEVDFVIPKDGNSLSLIEVKWTKTVYPSQANSLKNLKKAIKKKKTIAYLVHRKSQSAPNIQTIAPSIKGISVEDFLKKRS
jgi:uncharacterized protein